MGLLWKFHKLTFNCPQIFYSCSTTGLGTLQWGPILLWASQSQTYAQHEKAVSFSKHLCWKKLLRSESPTLNLALPSSLLNHVHELYIYMCFRRLLGLDQGWWEVEEQLGMVRERQLKSLGRTGAWAHSVSLHRLMPRSNSWRKPKKSWKKLKMSLKRQKMQKQRREWLFLTISVCRGVWLGPVGGNGVVQHPTCSSWELNWVLGASCHMGV